MQVRERMARNPFFVTPGTSVADAFQLMHEKSVRRLPVVNKDKLVGIVTLSDLSKASPSPATSLSIFEINYLLSKAKIKEIIPKNMKVVTIEADANIERAAILMREHKIGGIPVMEGQNLVGMITETDIFDAFIDILGVNHPGTRIDLEVEDGIGVAAEITSIIAMHGISIQNMVLIEQKPQATFEVILRIATQDSMALVEELREKGFKVKNVITKS